MATKQSKAMAKSTADSMKEKEWRKCYCRTQGSRPTARASNHSTLAPKGVWTCRPRSVTARMAKK